MGGKNPSSWFLRRETTSTLKISVIPSGTLRDRVQKSFTSLRGPDGGYIKVIEDAGTPLGQLDSVSSNKAGKFGKKCVISDEYNY